MKYPTISSKQFTKKGSNTKFSQLMTLNEEDLKKLKCVKDGIEYTLRRSDLSLIRCLQYFIDSKRDSDDFDKDDYTKIDPEIFDEFRMSEHIPKYIMSPPSINKINSTLVPHIAPTSTLMSPGVPEVITCVKPPKSDDSSRIVTSVRSVPSC